MAKRQKKEAPKEVQEIPNAWDGLNDTEEVKIEMNGLDFTVSVNVARILIEKGQAKAK